MQLHKKNVVVFDQGEITLFPELNSSELVIKPDHKILSQLRGKGIAMVFQEPMTSLNPVMTCGDQLIEGLQLHLGLNKKEARARTLELFREVQLPRAEEMLDQFPHQLSGGQRQRSSPMNLPRRWMSPCSIPSCNCSVNFKRNTIWP
jgi:peptide/nickel transport system ATP-binding protein